MTSFDVLEVFVRPKSAQSVLSSIERHIQNLQWKVSSILQNIIHSRYGNSQDDYNNFYKSVMIRLVLEQTISLEYADDDEIA